MSRCNNCNCNCNNSYGIYTSSLQQMRRARVKSPIRNNMSSVASNEQINNNSGLFILLLFIALLGFVNPFLGLLIGFICMMYYLLT
jgi:hypothetical protein